MKNLTLDDKKKIEKQISYEENNELLRLAKSDDVAISDKARERLVMINAGLVKSIASHYLNRGIEYDDLIQIGMLGLMRAILGFDPEKGFAFSTYATPVIAGEIKRQIRDTGYVKVSRIYKRNAAMLLRERTRITEEEGREPGIAELAELCGLDVAEASVALDSAMPVISLDSMKYSDGDASVSDFIASEDRSDDIDCIIDSVSLSEEIYNLPPLWRKIIILRYYRDKTQCECASLLGLTQVKISREERKALDYLKSRL